MCARPKMPPAPPPPPQLPPAPPPPAPVIKSISQESGQRAPGAARGTGGVDATNMFSFLTQRRGKAMLTIPRG
jgi:hypothetical protein